MSVVNEFESIFSKDNLKRIYREHVMLSSSVGIDNVTHTIFAKNLEDAISIIHRKIRKGNYKFTKYKSKLISKGKLKTPRELSIPTIRDRIVIRALHEFIKIRFKNEIDMPQNIIKEVKKSMSETTFNMFIKLDIENFYPSIKHMKLLGRLNSRIKNNKIKSIIKACLETPTVSSTKSKEPIPKLGVPQGLSLSNYIADLYLTPTDNKINENTNLHYFRYVDDILIFCNEADHQAILKDVTAKFRRLGLRLYTPFQNSEKSKLGGITSKFEYLGYEFSNNVVSVREKSIEKLKDSIAAIFTRHKYSRRGKNDCYLLWRLNLRITGCVFENKCRGWLFFFSEINNEPLLHMLDKYLKKISQRFEKSINPKKFVRSFYLIKHKKYENNYIPNFDKYERYDKVKVLVDCFSHQQKTLDAMPDKEINRLFRSKIKKEVKHLLEDLKNFY